MSDERPTVIDRLRDELDQPGPPPPVPTTVALRRALGGAGPTVRSPQRALGEVPPWVPRPVRREEARPFSYGVRHEIGATSQECPGSVSGHDVGGTTDGTCAWCHRQVDPRPARPELPAHYRTELDLEYRRQYDPDWGDDPYDV